MSLLSQLPEDFLHYIWKSCNFNLHQLKSLGGEKIFIRNPGTWNRNQGPDFLDAQVSIDGMEWHGHVELHVNSQDWYKHGHHQDKNYNGTILHVAFISQGKQIFREDGSPIPELVLKERISPSLLNSYQELQLKQEKIPCRDHLVHTDLQLIEKTLEGAALERIREKAERIQQGLKHHIQNWEEVIWQELMTIMGGPVNKEAFRELAERMPLRILRKEQGSRMKLEAALFGAAGFLREQNKGDTYYKELLSQWHFLQHKHKLPASYPLNFFYHRMRPASFPTIRISQMAELIMQTPSLTNLLEESGWKAFQTQSIEVSPYWQNHNRFFEEKTAQKHQLGKNIKNLIQINCLLPIAHLYQEAHGNQSTGTSLLNALIRQKKEDNRITRLYSAMHWPNAHAVHSQGMLQLYKFYCQERRCLDCEIGREILA
ncbi:MAG: DUF2851 family protein [Bacteroidia bacterium]|nr:DUF2851 family protein [Bacteroidia bacterium]